MRTPEEARIRKLEDRLDDRIGAIHSALEELEDRSKPMEIRVRRAKRMLRPFDIRSEKEDESDAE